MCVAGEAEGMCGAGQQGTLQLSVYCSSVPYPFPLLQREEARKAAAQALLEEVAAGNAELAERKRQQKAAEAAESLQIAEYIRQRDAREQVGWRAGAASRLG